MSEKWMFSLVLFLSLQATNVFGQCDFLNIGVQDPNCGNANDGVIVIDLQNTTPPVQYNWSSGQGVVDSITNQGNSVTLTGFTGGSYNFTITDAGSCMLDTLLELAITPGLDVTFEATDLSCPGSMDGSIRIIASGGTRPYTYGIQGIPAVFDSLITGLPAGLIPLFVEDAEGCIAFFDVPLNEPTELVTSTTITDASCSDSADGRALFTTTGGTSPYVYRMAGVGGFSTSGLFLGLSPGPYRVTVTDAAGCTELVLTAVGGPGELRLDVTETPDECGLCNGSVDLNAIGGTPPYTYDWEADQYDGLSEVDSLCAGLYILTISDANGCTSLNEFDIDFFSTDQLLVAPTVMASSCDSCNGEIDLRLSCGTPPFMVNWSDPNLNGQTQLNDLCPGVAYSVTIVDGANNIFIDSFDIGTAEPLTAEIDFSELLCRDRCIGEIRINPSGGVPPYAYGSPSGGAFSSGLCPGNYGITVIDAVNCVFTDEVTIEVAPLLEVEARGQDVDCFNEGIAWVEVSGGIPPYTFDWNTNESTDTIRNLEQGEYWVTVIDSIGCSLTDSLFIDTPIRFDLFSTPANCDSTGGTAFVELIDGVNNPAYAWSNGGTGAIQNDLRPGGYSVTITDQDSGCEVHRNIIVSLDTACFVRISGRVYLDNQVADCVLDGTTRRLGNIMVTLDNGEVTFTNSAGYYEFRTVPGNYIVEVNLNTGQYDGLCTQPISVSAPDNGGNYPDNDFWVDQEEIQNLRVRVNKFNARPGFEQRLNIIVSNLGSEAKDGVLTFVHDPIQQYMNQATIPPTSYDENTSTLEWAFTDLAAGEERTFTVYLNIPTSTMIGTLLAMNFEVTPSANDISPDDNILDCEFTVTGSYDPNDKQVIPVGEGAEGGISREDSLLTYRIRFQNTGTDTAFTVVLLDTLDSDLNIGTLVPGPASHEYHLNVLKGNILEFTFENILLPDSFTNEPASNGYVFFDIELNEGLAYGTTIENRAAIYFDFNEPIITSTVVNTLRRPVGIFDPDAATINLQAQPNPGKGLFELSYALEKNQFLSIELYDLSGHHLRQIEPPGLRPPGTHQLSWLADDLSPGVYLITLEDQQHMLGTLKLVVLGD